MNQATELHSSTVRQISLIATTEVRRLLSQTKGIVTLAAYVMLWLLILLFLVRDAVNLMLHPEAKDIVMQVLGEGAMSNLFNWPVEEFAMYWVFAIMLQPMFAILLGAGQFADDIQRGTFRFLSLHASRIALFFGRFLGAMAVMALLSGATSVVTMVMAMVRDIHLALPALICGLQVWLVILLMLLPYVALMSLLSVIASSSKQAVLYSVLFFTGLSLLVWLADVTIAPLAYLEYVMPGTETQQLMSVMPTQAPILLKVALIQTVAFLALGFYAFKRSDV